MDTRAYLSKFGWSTGEGLGKNRQGRASIIQVSSKNDQKGVGAREDWTDSHSTMVESTLKNINIKVGSGSDSDSDSSSSSESEDDTESRKLNTDTGPAPKDNATLPTSYGGFFHRATQSDDHRVDTSSTHSRDIERTPPTSGHRVQTKFMYKDRMLGKLKRIQRQELESQRGSKVSESEIVLKPSTGTESVKREGNLSKKKSKKRKRSKSNKSKSKSSKRRKSKRNKDSN
eukprot:203309_1